MSGRRHTSSPTGSGPLPSSFPSGSSRGRSPAVESVPRATSIARLASPVSSAGRQPVPHVGQIASQSQFSSRSHSPLPGAEGSSSLPGPGQSALAAAFQGSLGGSPPKYGTPPVRALSPPAASGAVHSSAPHTTYGSFESRSGLAGQRRASENPGEDAREDPRVVKRHLVLPPMDCAAESSDNSNGKILSNRDTGMDEDEFSSLRLQGGDMTREVYRWTQDAESPTQGRRGKRSKSWDLSRPEPESEELDINSIRIPGGFRRDHLRRRAPSLSKRKGRAMGLGASEVVPRPSPSQNFISRNFLEFLTVYGHFAGEELEEEDEDGYFGSDTYLDAGFEREGSDESDGEQGEGSALLTPSTPGRRKRKTKQRGTPGTSTPTEAALLLLKSFVGTGVLFLPRAYLNGGMLFSNVVLLSVAMLSYYCFILLVNTRLVVVGSFGDIGGILYGKWMRSLILSSVTLSQIGFVSAYIVFTSENLQAFVVAVSDCRAWIDIKAMVAMQLVIFLPLSLIRDIGKLGATALVADVFILLGLVYLAYYDIHTLVANRGVADIIPFNPREWTLFIGTAIFTFEGVGLIIPIQESMKQPRKFPPVLAGVMIIITILFVGMGALSYAAFGSVTKTVVLLNLPQDSKLVNAVQLLYSLAILLSTPLQLFPAIRIMESELFSRSGKDNPYIKWKKNVFRFFVVVMCGLIAWGGAGDLDKFVSLVGSFACVPLVYVYPKSLSASGLARFSGARHPPPLLMQINGDMPGDGEPQFNHPGDEDSSQGRPERLSRSPHPYHRRGASCSQDNDTIKSYAHILPASTLATSEPNEIQETTYFDADHRKRRELHESASDSGTEADDEKGAFLLGLPAPPARPRKGLKDGSETASPLLTPSYLDDGRRKAALEARGSCPTSLQGQSMDEETVKLREKFSRRRRAELIRRITETILLLVVCYIAITGHFPRPWVFPIQLGAPADPILMGLGLNNAPLPVLSYITIVLGVYALYPLRIIKRNHNLNTAQQRSRFYIHLPTAFDPAPLLYPVLLPVVMAWSIAPASPRILLPNLVLGIASIPRKIIPFGDLPWHSSPQWLLSIVPIVTYPAGVTRCSDGDSKEWPGLTDIESLLPLYPLHQALLPILQYLTTTSLLPAELQLLSASMINLLLLSTSPQALILKALLWIGGFLVLVTCKKVLNWGVALARIPSWRFRRPRGRLHRNNALVIAIDDSLNGRLSRWGFTTPDFDSCDSEAELPEVLKGRNLNLKTLDISTSALETARGPTPLHLVSTTPMSATGDGKGSRFPGGNGPIAKPMPGSERLRRNTLPTCIASSTDGPLHLDLQRAGSQILQRSKFWSFRSMTASQATVLRWFFAIYVYSIIIAIIALPVRVYVQRFALNGRESVGWALGYLFGDLSIFKALVEDWNLRPWVNVPAWTEDHTMVTKPARSADLFCSFLGPANTRLVICIHCLSVIVIGLMVVLRLSAVVEVDTRRKVFHGMMVAMFLPTIFVDSAFVSLALVLILAIFLLLDLFRASQLPPISKPLTHFLAPYVDGRDHRGPVIVSHIFLLIGCAIPLWLSMAALPRGGWAAWEGWEVPERDLSMIAGVVCVGMGDAAASLIGRRYGRRRWCWSGGKSLEGSLAFAIAVVLGLTVARLWLLVGGWQGDNGNSGAVFLIKAVVAASGASLTEAVLTGGNDNVIVPVILWLLVRGLRM
ncbi:MAG: hypothetical protein Q9217_004819 [Psora testacea]